MPGSRVYVGNIRDDVRERDVEKFFKGFGGLREITLKNGFGFVEFEDDRDADDACHDLDGKDLMGGRVRVELARERGRGGDRFGGGRDGDRGGFSRGRSPPRRGGNPPGRKTNYRIIVENLSSRTSWQVDHLNWRVTSGLPNLR